MKELYIQAVTEMGAVLYGTIKVSDDYTMNEVVKAVKDRYFIAFRIVDTMNTFVNV